MRTRVIQTSRMPWTSVQGRSEAVIKLFFRIPRTLIRDSLFEYSIIIDLETRGRLQIQKNMVL